MTQPETPGHPHVCPVWVGYLLASPLRKLLQNPDKILAPYVKPGMTVLDVGAPWVSSACPWRGSPARTAG